MKTLKELAKDSEAFEELQRTVLLSWIGLGGICMCLGVWLVRTGIVT